MKDDDDYDDDDSLQGLT